MKRSILKFLKITGIVVVSVLLLLFLIPILFPGAIAEKTKAFANKSINGKLDFSKVRLSFFNHFPSLTITLYDVVLNGSAPFRKDTLVSSEEISLGINLKSLIFNKRIDFNEIYLTNSFMNVRINKKGEANYNVYQSNSKDTATSDTAGSTSLRLEKIIIDNTHFIYDDKSTDLYFDAKGFNYRGKGDLSQDIFDLTSRLDIDSLDFNYANEPYLIQKRVAADLITRINTSSLAFIFQKNDLRINRLPVEFSGKLDFLKNGYDIDLNLKSAESDLHDLITALPPQYITWMEKTKVRGTTSIAFSLKGQYVASENRSPDLSLDWNIRDGYIKYEDAPVPISNLYLNLATRMPSLNTDSLHIRADSLFLNVEKDYLSSVFDIKGLKTPFVDARLKALIDMSQISRSLGVPGMQLGGAVNANVISKGLLDIANNKFPVTDGVLTWKNGIVQTKYYPHPITNIQVDANMTDKEGTLSDLHVRILPFSFQFENNPFNVRATIDNFKNVAYDIKAKGEIDVAKIYQVFAQEGLDLKGYIKADLDLQGSQDDAEKGRYDRLRNRGTLQLRDIKTTSEFFPHPFIVKQGLFRFNQDKMHFDDFKGVYAHSDFLMNGYLANVIDYALSSSAVLRGQFNLNSNYINADEFTTSARPSARDTSVSTSSAGGVVIVPPQYNLALTANAKKLTFNGLELDSLHGRVAIDTGTISLQKTGFNMIGCQVNMDALYGAVSSRRAHFDYAIQARDFNVARAYREVKLFHDLASAAEHAAGIVSLDYKLKGVLEGDMHPAYPSLEGGGTVSLSNVKVKGFKLFSAIGKATSRDSISEPDMRKVDIKSTIKNNVITIERFKFKVAGFRPRIEGRTNFDGQLDLKVRLGLPPFGIIGIPLNVSGTQDDPKVHLGRGKKNKVAETIYNPSANKKSNESQQQSPPGKKPSEGSKK